MRFFGGQCVFWLRPAERKCSRQFALWRCSLKGFGTFFQITALQLLSKPQWFAVRWFNVIPRPEVVKVIADLLRDKYPILATNVRKTKSSKTSPVPHDHDGGQPSHCQLLQPPLGGGVATFIVFSQRRLFVQGIIRFFSSNPRRLRQSAEPLTRRTLTLAAKAQNFSLKMLISCSNAATSDKRWLLYQLDQSNWWSDSASDGTAQ